MSAGTPVRLGDGLVRIAPNVFLDPDDVAGVVYHVPPDFFVYATEPDPEFPGRFRVAG